MTTTASGVLRGYTIHPKVKIQFIVFFLVLCGLACFRLWGSRDGAFWVVRYGGYWITLLLTALAGAAFFHVLKSGGLGERAWKKCRVGWMIALCGAALWQVHEPHRLRVLFDEFGYMGAAKIMHEKREAVSPVRAHYYDGQLRNLNYAPDKRAVLFPFLVSVVHDLTGFRVSNVYWVNGFLGFFSLLLMFYLVRSLADERIAWCAQIAWAGLPLLAQSATGGGYDLLNTCLIQGWLLLALKYIEKPGVGGLNFLVLVACMLAQVRNESVIFALGTGLVILAKWRRDHVVQLTWVSVLAGLFFLLPLSANMVFTKVDAMRETLPGQAFFSLEYVADNLRHAVVFMFNPDLDGLNSLLLSVIGVLAVLFFIIRYLTAGRENRIDDASRVLFVFSGMIFLTFVIFMCSFWGNWTDPLVSRFSIGTNLLFVVLAARIFREELGERRVHGWVLAGIAAYAFLFELPASAQATATEAQNSSREFAFVQKAIEAKTPGEILVVTQGSIMPIVIGHASVSITAVNAAPWKIQAILDKGMYKEIWVAQRYSWNVSAGEWRVAEREPLVEGFELEFVDQIEVSLIGQHRIYRIVGWHDKEDARAKVREIFTPAPKSVVEYAQCLFQILP